MIAGQTYSFHYTYNLAGSLTFETYPSGRVVNTSYDFMNRVNGVSGVLNGLTTDYVTGATYAAHGAPVEYKYGNNLWRDYTYNKRLQPGSAADTVGGASNNTHLYLTWDWGTASDNGNLLTASAWHGGPGYQQFLTFNDSYLYDGVNRLAAVYDNDANNNPLWARIFGYDRYGNMWLSVNSGVPLYGTMPTSSTNFNTATNRLISGAAERLTRSRVASERRESVKILLLAIVLSTAALEAQTEGLWQGYDGEWGHVSRQLVALAEATPPEKFAWRPAPGVRSTSEVYMHIALANFYLLSVTSPKMPAEIKSDDMEKTVTAKAEVIDWLKRSLDAVKTAHVGLKPDDLQRKVKINDRDATVDGMYLRIIVHANEHMGQLVAYARMNGIVPPWSKAGTNQ